jgi:CubicO group peptidase (beta-lactamase class C family)
LTHRAGIRAYHDDREALNTIHYRTVTDSLEKFKDDPLVFPPDTDFQYSNYGYVLLSAAVEGASGEDYLSAMRRLVFNPLGMRGTVENRPHEEAAEQAAFYDHEVPYSPDGNVAESPFIDFSCKWATGGFLSTAQDMARFGSAHIAPTNGGYLQADTLDMMFTPRSSQAGIVGYGMGWMTARDLHLRRVRFHFGAGSGGTSVLAIYPEDGTCVAIVGNLGHAKFGYNRLAGVSNPFLSDPAAYVLAGFVGLTVLGLGWAVRRRLRRRRSVVAEPGAAADGGGM